MSGQVSTIYLTSPIAPGGKDWHKGYIETHDAKGVAINSSYDGRGERVFYPIHNVQRIAYGTGW